MHSIWNEFLYICINIPNTCVIKQSELTAAEAAPWKKINRSFQLLKVFYLPSKPAAPGPQIRIEAWPLNDKHCICDQKKQQMWWHQHNVADGHEAIRENSACSPFNANIQHTYCTTCFHSHISFWRGQQTQSVSKKATRVVGLKIPFCVKKEMWKQLWEECHLCPASLRAWCSVAVSEAADRQTAVSHYVSNLIEIGVYN